MAKRWTRSPRSSFTEADTTIRRVSRRMRARAFRAAIVLGMGFTFDDTDTKGVATPLAEMHRLIAEEPRNRNAIFPYIGGEEVNTSPTHAHHRYVINFRDYPLRREDLGRTVGSRGEESAPRMAAKGIVPLDYPEPVAATGQVAFDRRRQSETRDGWTAKGFGREEVWWQFLRPRPRDARCDRRAGTGLISWLYLSTSSIRRFSPKRMVYSRTTQCLPLHT